MSGFSTDAIHGGDTGWPTEPPLVPPIYQTSTYRLQSFKNIEKLFSLKKRGYVYTRGGNPTVNLLERRMALLEHGIDAVCFSSGMGAISGVLFSFLQANDHIIASDTLYGSARSFIEIFLKRYGIESTFIDLNNTELFEKSFRKETKVVYFETPANPTLKVIDIRKVAKIAHKHGAKVIVDNTFMTPYFQNPLDLGADVVLHSLTKYINGHGDALGGVAIAKNQDYIDYLKFGIMSEVGSVLDPHSAFLILRGLKTLDIRMKKHQDNALKLARFLEKQPFVKQVFYPGLKSFPWRRIVERQMRGFGGILSFELKANLKTTLKLIESLQLATLAVSLGDAETLVEHPLSMTHRVYLDKPDSEIYKRLENMVRVSVGLEDPDDIIEDFKRAFKKVGFSVS